jgi:hypothetical protein
MANSYDLNLTDGTLDFTINEKEVLQDHGLTFTGRGVEDYGEHRNTNLLHMAENFASDTAPSNPLTGQVWYNTSINQIRVWDGATWAAVAIDDYILSGTYNVDDGFGTVIISKNPAGDDPTDVTIDNIATYTNLQNHITASPAHNASAISFDDTSVPFIANDVQEAIEDTYSELTSHLTDATDAHDASAISFVSYLSINQNDVQDALEDLEDEIDLLNSNISTAQTQINNHISDATDAHDASAISYDNTTSGLTANDVQDAIEEVETAAVSAATIGLVDWVRVKMNTNHVVSGVGSGGGAFGTPEHLSFNDIEFGDNLGNYDDSFGNWRYVADRDMEVRARAYVYFDTLNDNQYGHLRIVKNGGTIIRNGFIIALASSATPSTQTVEISVIDELNNGDYLEVYAVLQSFGTASNTTVLSGREYTGFEIEVLRDLTP